MWASEMVFPLLPLLVLWLWLRRCRVPPLLVLRLQCRVPLLLRRCRVPLLLFLLRLCCLRSHLLPLLLLLLLLHLRLRLLEEWWW